MNRIFNWTIGSFFRTLGRIICYLSIGFIIAIIASKFGINLGFIRVNASTISVSDAQYNLYTAITRDGCELATAYGYKNLDTSIDISEKPYISKIHYLFSANLSANQSYTLSFIQSYNPKSSALQTIKNAIYKLEGGTTTSNLSSNNISSFKCFATNINNQYQMTITCNFVPLTDIKKIWIEQLQPNCGTSTTYFNTYHAKINSNSSTEQSINNQTEVIIDKSDKIINEQEKTNDILNDDNVTDAESSAGNFFSDFNTDTHGLTGIITAPLNAIQSLTSKTCNPLVLPLPFVNENLTLPCMRPIYEENFGSFMNLYDIITLGIVSYWIMVRIFTLVKDFKNPDHDEIEVMDL